MESKLDNHQLVFVGVKAQKVVGYSADGSADWQAKILDQGGFLIATVHGMTEREANENAEYIVQAINYEKENSH